MGNLLAQVDPYRYSRDVFPPTRTPGTGHDVPKSPLEHVMVHFSEKDVSAMMKAVQ